MKAIAVLAAAAALQALAMLPPTAGATRLLDQSPQLRSVDNAAHVEASAFERVALQSEPTADTTGSNATDSTTPTPSVTDEGATAAPTADATNEGDDDETQLISELISGPGAVSLLADAAPWTFKLSADARQTSHVTHGRELVAAFSPLPTSQECPVYARTARNVLVAVSSCFTKAAFSRIEAWIDDLKKNDLRYFPEDTQCFDLDVRWVEDGCGKPSWGKKDKELKGDSDDDFIAAVSVTVHDTAAKTVAQFIQRKNLPPPIGYVYNGPTSLKLKQSDKKATDVIDPKKMRLTTTIPGYLVALWNDIDKGFLCHTDLLDVLREVHCATLVGSKASLFVVHGKRQCFCSCDAGYEFVDDECKPKTADEDCTCPWSDNKNGYKFETTTAGTTCLITNTGTIPAPVAGDNYVDRDRHNNGDLVKPLSSPRIELLNHRRAITLSGWTGNAQDAESLDTATFTWKEFQTAAVSPVSKLDFKQFGQYEIELQAFDYGANATCVGCVLVVDSFRPTHHSNYPCPAKVVDTIADFTSATVAKYQQAVSGVLDFSAHALNDGCSLNHRCDAEVQRTKTFVQASYGPKTETLNGASDYFQEPAVKQDLAAKLTGSPFTALADINTCTAGDANGCVQETCERCIDVSTSLQEWWVNYKCGERTATAECAGTEPACRLERCLMVNATSILSASAQLSPSVEATSLAVLKAKDENRDKSDVVLTRMIGTTAHFALVNCTEFNVSDANCAYTTTVAALIETSVTALGGGLFSNSDVKDFVGWRYNVEGNGWKTLSAEATETFNVVKTGIKVEAWSKCGRVQTFEFFVVLHLNNKIEVCEKFPSMWYQTTTPSMALLDKTSEVCMFPKSDFAEVTFDYKPNVGLRNGTLEMTITAVTCTMQYDGSAGNATIVSVTKSPYQIVKELAIDGVRVLTTDALTKVHVSCSFTYTRTLDAAKETQICSRSLIIKDCTPPTITKPCPFQDKCDFTQCTKANNGLPDLYQACGGNRVTQSNTGVTTIVSTEATCCPSCGSSEYKTTCTPLRFTPGNATSDNQFIKRCEAELKPTATTPSGGGTTSYGPYSEYDTYGAYSMLEAAVANVKTTATNGAGSALAGVSALVAVVALVVVRRRHAVADRTVIEEDAYYPLMG